MCVCVRAYVYVYTCACVRATDRSLGFICYSMRGYACIHTHTHINTHAPHTTLTHHKSAVPSSSSSSSSKPIPLHTHVCVCLANRASADSGEVGEELKRMGRSLSEGSAKGDTECADESGMCLGKHAIAHIHIDVHNVQLVVSIFHAR